MSFFSRIWDPCGSRHNTNIGSRIRMDLLPYCEDGSSYDHSGSVGKLRVGSIRIRDPDPWDQILGSVFRIHGHVWSIGLPFSELYDHSHSSVKEHLTLRSEPTLYSSAVLYMTGEETDPAFPDAAAFAFFMIYSSYKIQRTRLIASFRGDIHKHFTKFTVSHITLFA